MLRITPLRRAALLGVLLAAPAVAAPPVLADATHNIAVIRGFTPPKYDRTSTARTKLPTYPAPTNPDPAVAGYQLSYGPNGSVFNLRGYTYSEVSFDQVVTDLNDPAKGYDTAVLYGVRWDDPKLSDAGRTAINQFALKHKLIIWDADSTVINSGATPNNWGGTVPFIVPFGEYASGEHAKSGGVYTWGQLASNPLASQDAAQPHYLNAQALVNMPHAIGDANVMTALPAGWQAAMYANNKQLSPSTGTNPYPVLAWGYGDQGAHTGMIVYSGIDADAFNYTPPSTCPDPAVNTDPNVNGGVCVNWAMKALAIQLAAPFSSAADAGCAPNCAPLDPGAPSPTPSSGTVTPPAVTGTPPAQSGGSTPQGAAQTTTVTATCGLAAAIPTRWVRGLVTLKLSSSVSGASALAVSTAGGLSVASSSSAPANAVLKVNTKRLPSNRTSNLLASVLAGSTRACSVSFRLRVDNTPARLLTFSTKVAAANRLVSFKPTEAVKAKLLVKGRKTRYFSLKAGKKVTIRVVHTKASARLLLTDRAGNVTTKVLKLA